MRHITKQSEPPSFTAWKALANEEWQPAYANLHNPEKSELHSRLLHEQGFICCYCEQRIDLKTSHIEHLVAQSSIDPAGGVDFDNLLASCQGEEAPPVHCGHFKGRKRLPVTPLMPDCADYFVFGSNGSIGSADDEDRSAAANEAIAVLELDHAVLQARRRRAIDAVLSALPNAPITSVIQRLLTADDGRYVPHATAIAFVLAKATTSGTSTI